MFFFFVYNSLFFIQHSFQDHLDCCCWVLSLIVYPDPEIAVEISKILMDSSSLHTPYSRPLLGSALGEGLVFKYKHQRYSSGNGQISTTPNYFAADWPFFPTFIQQLQSNAPKWFSSHVSHQIFIAGVDIYGAGLKILKDSWVKSV